MRFDQRLFLVQKYIGEQPTLIIKMLSCKRNLNPAQELNLNF